MKAKIISFEEAKKAGLTNEKGSGVVAAGFVERKENGKIIKVEKTIIRGDGSIELEFMSEERKQELKSRRQFSAYIKQFNKIPEGLK